MDIFKNSRYDVRHRKIVSVVLVSALFILLPGMVSDYHVKILFVLFMYLVLSESFDILRGYTGYINLGHSVFFGIGAYVFSFFIVRGFGILLSIFIGVMMGLVFSVVMSFPFFRLRGAYFTMSTLGLAMLFNLLAFNLEKWTGGYNGLPLPLQNTLIPTYIIAFFTVIAVVFVNHYISRSEFGLALLSIKDDEEVAEVFGINSFKLKTLALVLSSIFPAFMGAIFAWNNSYVYPDMVFGLGITFLPATTALLGGTGRTFGPILGGFIMWTISEILWVHIPYFQLFIQGAILVVVGLFIPEGLISLFEKFSTRFAGKFRPV